MKVKTSSLLGLSGWRARLKEPFSSLSHLAGAVWSLVALLALLLAAQGRPIYLISFSLYGVSLVAVFVASSLYHSLTLAPAAVARLQRMDYIAIFLLIAGTYAPVSLLVLHGVWGWSLFGTEYALALGGIAAVVFLRRRFPEWLRVGLCAVMTWLIVVAAKLLWTALPPAGDGWLLAGLITYTIGTLILAVDWPHLWPGRFSAHDLWHLFVLGGSACHFVLMYRYIAPNV